MPDEPETGIILLPRAMSALVIEAAVHFAVALENERRRPWPVSFIRRVEPGGIFMIGQNSCYAPAKLLVHPEQDASFRAGSMYKRVEVEWYSHWPRIEHTCSGHGRVTRPAIIQAFRQRLTTVLKLV